MKHEPNLTATPVQLSSAFWALFMTSKVMVRFVSSFICFGLIDEKNQLLIVYAHDTGQSFSPPTASELRRAFPLRNMNRITYTGPHQLPVPYSEIGGQRQVLQYTFKQGARRVLLLVPDTSKTLATKRKQLLLIQWSRPDPTHLADLVQTLGRERVHLIQKNALETRILLELNGDERIELFESGLHFRGGTFSIPRIFPVHCESATA